MSDHTGQGGTIAKVSDDQPTATATQHDGSNDQAHDPLQGTGRGDDGSDAASESKETDAPARQPVQLKSHFRGMPKDWPINRSKYIPAGALPLLENLGLTPFKRKSSKEILV